MWSETRPNGKPRNVTCHIMTTLLKDDFKTNIGTISTWIESRDTNNVLSKDDYIFKSKGLEITLQSTTLDIKEIPQFMQFETSHVWRWFIRKINSDSEELSIYCKLIDPSSDCKWEGNPGEHLEAIEIENQDNHLHIGTEDGDIMKNRAEKSDWMPNRFKDKLGSYQSFTEYIDFGFKIQVPNLDINEEIYFHFLVATNIIKPSVEYPNERDVSTWYGVDRSKTFLDSH